MKSETTLNQLRCSQPTTPGHTKSLNSRLDVLDTKFKSYHIDLVELIGEDEDELLEREQEVLDEHDDTVADLKFYLQSLCLATMQPFS